MIIISTPENPTKNYVGKVFNLTTKAGQPMTVINLTYKDKEIDKFVRTKITVWSKLEIKENDLIEITGINSLRLKPTYTKGDYKINEAKEIPYTMEITCHSNQIKVYENKEETIAKEDKPQLGQAPSRLASLEPIDSGEDLPF